MPAIEESRRQKIAEIIKLNERRPEKRKPAQSARRLMALPAKQRLKLIVESANAQSMVAALDANDFFHTIQEIGPDDSLQLLALASVEQMNHLFDIEWWSKDSLVPAKALAWMERLSRAGGSRLLEWISNADFELLVSLFKKWITVDIAPEDVDLVEAAESLPPQTLDDLYFWESRYPQYDDLITHLLTVIFEANYGFFKELMNSVIYSAAAEVDESAYHFHRGRLQDHSIPDFYDSLEIYRSIQPGEFTIKTIPGEVDEDRRIPSFALAPVPGGDLFARVVSRIEDPALIDTLQAEMAALANKVTVADRLPPDDFGALRHAVDKALAYVNLGLELRSGADIEKAAAIVRDNFLEHFFRFAHAEVSRIKGRLQAIVRGKCPKGCPLGIKWLDGEWFEAAEELLAGTPRIVKKSFDGNASGAPPVYEFLRTSQDLERAGRIVDTIGAAGDLYRLLNADPAELGQNLWTDGQVRVPEDITLGVLVLTAAANFLTSGEWRAEPLPRSGWPETFPLLQPGAVERTVMDWVNRSVPDRQRRSLAQVYLIPILRDYEFEMRPFSSDNPPEADLVKFFMFSPA